MAVESARLVRHKLDENWLLQIGGKDVEARSGLTFDVINPATEAKLAKVARAGSEDIDLAVAAARRSLEEGVWRSMNGADRGRVLWRFADLIESHGDDLAHLETLNNGMPITMAKMVTRRGADWLRWLAGACTRVSGVAKSSSLSVPGEWHAYTRKEPVGVVGLITPWNGPIGTFIIKVGPALAAGCSCVLKPSEVTPLTALRLGHLALDAGLPAGVLNIVPGYGVEAGAAIANHPDVEKISFTGSTAVGKELARAATGNLKRVTLELGGKSPCVVFDDADMDIAIPGAAMAIARNSGQVCFAGSRLFVQRKSYERVVSGIAKHFQSLKIGNGLEKGTILGPLVSKQQLERVKSYIDIGRTEGATMVSQPHKLPEKGYYVSPTIFADASPTAKIVREEIFGPVLVAASFDTAEELPALANATPYGLGAGIYTSNLRNAHRIAARIRAGNVWINCYSMMDPAMPFGGFKQSGWGRELGEEGMQSYLETKSVWVNLD